jgi:hypothetical protein
MSKKDKNERHARSTHLSDMGASMSRREFAAMSGVLSLGALLPNVKWLDNLPFAPGKFSARLVDQRVESLVEGGTRTTVVTEYDSPAGLVHVQGYETRAFQTRQTAIEVRQPTPTGDRVEYDISFDPPVPTADGKIQGRRVQMRCEFVHGERRGDVREDVAIVTVSGDGVIEGTIRKRVLRPIAPPGGLLAHLTPEQRTQRFVELVNSHGGVPHELPGAIQVIGDA